MDLLLKSSVLLMAIHAAIVGCIGVRVIMRRAARGIALSWLLLVAMLPYVGALLYLLVGERRIGRARSQGLEALRADFRAIAGATIPAEFTAVDWSDLPPAAQALDRLGRSLVGGATVCGNRFELFSDTQAILAAIDGLVSDGSTNGEAGLKLAYEVAVKQFGEGATNRVMLCTDGDFNVGESADSELVKLIEKQRQTGVFLNIFGFGSGNLKDAKLEAIADKGNGQYIYIDGIKEARKTLLNELTGTLYTIAKDVKLQLEFNPNLVGSYRLVGYENRAMAAKDFANDKVDSGDMGAGHSVVALYEIVPSGAPQPVAPKPETEPLKYQRAGSVSDRSSGRSKQHARSSRFIHSARRRRIGVLLPLSLPHELGRGPLFVANEAIEGLLQNCRRDGDEHPVLVTRRGRVSHLLADRHDGLAAGIAGEHERRGRFALGPRDVDGRFARRHGPLVRRSPLVDRPADRLELVEFIAAAHGAGHDRQRLLRDRRQGR